MRASQKGGASGQATRHLALLRGINVGGKNRLPMKDLCALFAAAGCSEITSYIQSGNVVFSAPAERIEHLGRALEDAVATRFGFHPPFVFRTANALRTVIERNPFLGTAAPADRLHVAFLAETPTRERAAALDVNRSPPDRFALVGRDLYLHFPNGVGKTRLTNDYLDRTLQTVSTLRNWRTVLALRELL